MKLIKLLVMISVIGGIILLTGCAGFVNKEKVVKDALENKYGEEMLIYSVDVQGSKFYAKCAPASNPEVVFETNIFSDGTEEWDDYYWRYVAKQLEKILEDDLEQFFPDAYYRADIMTLTMIDQNKDFRTQTLEEILENAQGEAVFLDVYVNKEVGSTKQYKEEFKYFSETISEYVDSNRMLPIIVSFYYVNKSTQDKVRDYFKTDLDEDHYYESVVLGVPDFKLGVCTSDVDDVGTPPNISANFLPSTGGWIGSEEEYIRRRELIEKESLY